MSTGLVEQRTIDIIPENERHGRPRDLFTIWFGSNILPLTIITGALGPAAFGLNFWASLIAIVLGNLGGGLFMALHSVQGPKLGVPQMIQSRGQFGSIGAVIVVLVAVIMYVGFFASNLYLSGEAINAVFPSVSTNTGQIGSAIIGFVIVVFGYKLIHGLNKIATIVLGIVMIAGIVYIPIQGVPADFFTRGSSDWGAFLGMVSIAALWQLAYAPYVSDYSRYMPADKQLKETFLASYLGCNLGSILPMLWGVMVVLAYGGDGDAIIGINSLMGGLGGLFMVLLFLTASQSNAINLYGGTLCVITIVQTFWTKWVAGPSVRIVIAIIVTLLSLYFALSVSDFLTQYTNFVLLLLYLLIPWTAINLVDFYLVKKGNYHVESFFHPSGGIYGRLNWVALVAYAFGIIVQLPFMYPPDYYKGFAVDSLNGADIAWIVGLALTCPFYYILAKATGQDKLIESVGMPTDPLAGQMTRSEF